MKKIKRNKKKYLIGIIIIAVIVLILGLSVFLFFKKYSVINFKVISKTNYESLVLLDKLSESAQRGDSESQVFISEELFKLKKNNSTKLNLANSYLDKASLQFKEEEFANKALVLINEILKEEPKNNEAYLAAGYAYEVLQDYPKSFENYNKAIEINPNYDIAYVKRGHAYDLSGDLVAAEADYKKAFELNDKNDVALMNLARLAERKEDFELAKKYALSVIEISKIQYVKAIAYEIIGLAELDTSNYQLAIDNFSKSMEMYSKISKVHANRAYAKILLNDGNLSEAVIKDIEQDLLIALSIYEKDSYAFSVYGLLMEKIGNKERSVTYYFKALSLISEDITLGLNEKNAMSEKINISINKLDPDFVTIPMQ